MNLRLLWPVLLGSVLFTTPLTHAQSGQPQEPAGVADALASISSVPATHTAVTFDRDMLQSMLGEQPIAALNGITFESFRYHEPAFYIPENLAALGHDFAAAGWKHLVEANAGPRASAAPTKPITDMWFHFQGDEIDGVTVLIRASHQMNVIEISGLLRPLDLIHLSGHFGIPKVDPGAVMVPAPPGH